MLQSLLCAAAIVACAHALFDASVRVVQPIRDEGEEASLIFIPGVGISGDAYLETAQAIQNASHLRLWVALTGDYLFNFPNPLQVPGAVKKAISELRASGMNGDNHVGVAHSLGGVWLARYAPGSTLSAVVLLGAYISRDEKLRDFSKPVLTLSGELDGQTRISRIALDYLQLQQNVEQNPEEKYRTPVINIKGSCHAQFASGPMPGSVTKMDLKPNISNEEAHLMIGKHVSNFLAATLSNNTAMVKEAKTQLEAAFNDSAIRFQPMIDIKALEASGDSSPWGVKAQEHRIRDVASQVSVNNQVIGGRWGFLMSKPALQAEDSSKVEINTTTFLEFPFNFLDISTDPDSATVFNLKMKSRYAILNVLNKTGGSDDHPDTKTCMELNKLAVTVALEASTEGAQLRYKTRGRPITFREDYVHSTGILWAISLLKQDEDDNGLHVESQALYTTLDSSIHPGNHYCKLLSPYRAMEWINVDSLRTHPA